ncbi:putative DNA mismatch repair protein [Rhodotorula toruloides ATCC 204091]|uniref:Putative DNA mismatch repair protein n=1 Tax=Rhodotorula toruloides TaxID=5286 RepID=A0A0K3CMK2_RHOTO|nr:putative DNA mismatch repair protein [Rhodotorula toruloides ATCC 204091]PRQ71883.1 putative DNA mismatch repair protein [Rhodotorula toruloides]
MADTTALTLDERVQQKALTLPSEIWLRVLRLPTLDYADLKRFSRTIRRFHELEKSPSLDLKLFRQPFDPANPLKAGQPVRFHPVLGVTWLSRPDLDEADIMVFPKSRKRNLEEADEPMEGAEPSVNDDKSDTGFDGGVRHYKPLDLPVSAEYATSPPCTKVIFLAGTGPVMADKRGVRVRSVIEAVTSMWASPASAEHKFKLLIERGMGLEGGSEPTEEDLEELESMTMWDTLGDCTFWAGMSSARVVADNTVALRPNDFD